MQMRKAMLRTFAAVATLAVLAGCGGGAGGSAPSTGGSQPAPAPKKDSVVVTLPVDINTLDPEFVSQTQEWGILKHIDESLVFRDAKGQIQPWLAESWKQVDPLTWEFKLKQNVKFSDGEPFNADAVKYNLERTRDQSIKPRAQFPGAVNLDKVEVVDPYTVRIITKTPAPTMLTELFNLGIGSPKWFKEGQLGDIAKKPVGTGPYMLKEWVKDDHLTLVANPNYYGKPPEIKTITFRPIPELSTRISELQAGTIDLATDLSPDQIATVKGDANLSTLSLETGRRVFVGFNVTKKPFDDVRVRQAINYAINVDGISQALFGGGVKRMSSLVAPPNNDPSLQPYPYDPNKAKQLLADAGYANGFEAVLEHPTGRYIKDTEVVQAVAADLAKVGIKVKLVPMEWSAYSNKVMTQKNGDGMFLLGLSSAFTALTDIQNLSPSYPFNPTHWGTDQYNQLYDQLIKAPDDATRKAKSFELERYIVDQAPWAFLYRQPNYYAFKKGLQWEPRPDDYVYLYTAKWS